MHYMFSQDLNCLARIRCLVATLGATKLGATKLGPSTLTAAVFSLLTACGSGKNAAAPVANTPVSVVQSSGQTITPPAASPSEPLIQVSGRVLNLGYLGNTQVCADFNADGLCGEGEPSTLSDASGHYRLAVASGHRGSSLIAQVRPASVDSAATEAAPIRFEHGWTLSHLLEYEDDAKQVELNISPLTTVYYARMRQAGRNRLSNTIAVFTRIVSESNIDPSTQKLLVGVDFDYVASPKNSLVERLKSMSDVLSAKAKSSGAPLDMLTTTAMHAAWYNTYTGATATARSVPADASKIAALADTNNNSPAAYLAQDYRYFRPQSAAALRLREGLSETAGWLRKPGEGALASLDRRATTLSNGSIVYKLARWQAGDWASLTVAEAEYFTLNRSGQLGVHSATDDLQPRTITTTDGNALTYQLLNSNARLTFEVADSPATDFFIEEWIGQQDSYPSYYNGKAPTAAPVASKPSCVIDYPGTPQPNSANSLASSTITNWYTVCFNYFTAEYYDLVKKDLGLKVSDPQLPGANFYDATLKDDLLVAPIKTNCGSEAIPLATITTGGKTHCNWALDSQGGHRLQDVFAGDGITINSWSKTYGPATFTNNNVTTTLTAGSEAQLGLPQQLTLKLVRIGSETTGTGTLTSPYGAWSNASNQPVTEVIQWQIAAENPNLVLISWPFRDSGDPRVFNNQAADGTPAASAPVLPGGHFAATWNGNTFSAAPSTRTAPNYRKLALLLVDGHFITGQYYGRGYTYSERYFTMPAMEEGIDALNYIFSRLYLAGFSDK